MISNKIWLTAFYIHLAFGIVAVVSGIVLFFNKIVPFKSKWHKWLGKMYVIAILFFTGPTGFYLSFQAEGGAVATVGFLFMSFFWMYLTYRAFVEIAVKKNIHGHYKWMIRSYCFTLSGVTLRLLTPFGTNVLDLDPYLNFQLVAFLPWMINLVIGEIIIAINREKINNFKLTTERL